MSPLAEALVARVHQAEAECGGDGRAFAQHVLPTLLGELARAVGVRVVVAILDREFPMREKRS